MTPVNTPAQAMAAAAAEDLGACSGPDFPHAFWRRLGAAGLLGVGFPAEYGGQGRSLVEVAAAGAALVRAGGSLGLGLAWLLNEMLGRFAIAPLGDPAQRQALLPAMARGELLCAMAISEPGVGAHPKHLATRAERADGGWRITGEKAFVSNSPNAHLFIVLAISGESDGRKRFSAFLVPADAPGLSRVAGTVVTGLAPLGHCGLRLEACSLGAEALLGEEGGAFEALAKPFRDMEDALLPGLVTGAFGRELAGLGQGLHGRADDADRAALGELLTELAALAGVARQAAAMLESEGVGEPLEALNTGFKSLARRWQGQWESLSTRHGDPAPHLIPLTQDVNTLINLARRIGQARQQSLGAALLTTESVHEIALRTSL